MSKRICPQCGAPVDPEATECRYCGEKLELPKVPAPQPQPVRSAPVTPQPQYAQPQQPPQAFANPNPNQGYVPPIAGPGQGYPTRQGMPPQAYGMQQGMYPQARMTAISPAWPVKNKVVAGVLAILLGGLGIHKFYLGHIGSGVLYLLFCWTGIPELLGLIEGLIYLCSNDENFQLKHHVRLE